MRSGLKIEDIVVGSGDEAVRSKTVIANVHYFLNHGTELTSIGGPKIRIDLHRREFIAGLIYGIEGMRVGGRRKITISPHLAYGAAGVAGLVPPNAIIRCEVELLEVREEGVVKPEDFPPGRHLFVFRPGVAALNQPRWRFGLEEDGRCGIGISYPIPGMTWRHTRQAHSEEQLDAETTQELFQSAFNIPISYPNDCFQTEELWSDMSEKGNGITRNRASNTICLSIIVTERGQQLLSVNLAETSRAMLESPLLIQIKRMLKDDPK